ncbi:MAG: glycosyltransferase family 39 protein [Kouleothrix sp.]|nr:glycosyltransferase family 39 protein [Kouleothrix sp.]
MLKAAASHLAAGEAGPRQRERFRWRWLALAAILAGVALRVWQYAANPSIWVDEAAIARNVLDRRPWQLFGSLDFGQVAPPGFLLGIKLSVALLGPSEYALRLVPFVAGIASPALFFVVARSVLRPVGAVVATLMFSTAIPLIFFSSNLKQYSSDIAVTLLVIAIAIRLPLQSLSRRSACGFALVSLPLLFCSQAAVFPITVAGAVVLTDALLTPRPDRLNRLALVASWAAAVVAAATYGSWTMAAVDNAYLHRFWAQAFMPREGSLAWLWATAQNVFAGPPPALGAFDGSLHYPWPALFAALLAIGAVAILRRAPARGVAVAGPVVLALAAAAAQAYPVGTRVSLFLLPSLLLLVVAGAECVGRLVVRRPLGEYAPALLVPLALATLAQQPPPRAPEHLRPVMQYVSDRWKPGDALWVYYGAGQAFLYYARLIPLEGDIRIGDCN